MRTILGFFWILLHAQNHEKEFLLASVRLNISSPYFKEVRAFGNC